MAARNAAVRTLHARLNLPASFSHTTLEQCLVDSTRSTSGGNNELAKHGNRLLQYYLSNYVTTRWPRLPYKATTGVLQSYVGNRTLSMLAKEWGLEGPKATEGKDPEWKPPRKQDTQLKRPPPVRPGARLDFNRVPLNYAKDETAAEPQRYAEEAYADFVRAVIGAMELYTSPADVREFIRHHILSRHLDISQSFHLTKPQRMLSVLCKREGLERPITRLIAESGRRSNAAVFITGVFSGNIKLGEGQATSIRESEIVAQSNAMKSWYLFEDKEATSSVEAAEGKEFHPAMIDKGDIIV